MNASTQHSTIPDIGLGTFRLQGLANPDGLAPQWD